MKKLHKPHNELLTDLYSDYWDVRSSALAELKKIDDPESIHILFKEIEKRNDENLRFQFLILLEHFLRSNNFKNCGVALSCLILWKGKNESALTAKASYLIQDYIHTSHVLRYLKIKSIRFAWKRLPRSKRETLLDIISENHLRELSNIILSLFNNKNEDVLIKVVRALLKFKDKRGNRYIKKILQKEKVGVELKSTCINYIGVLGNIYDYPIVGRFLLDHDPDIQTIAIRAYSRLLGVFAVSKLKKLFYLASNDRVKLEILSRLGKINHRWSVKVLTEFLLQDFGGDVGLHVEWAMHDVDNALKVPYLISTFRTVEDKDKIHILNFLTDVSDHRIEAFVFDIIYGNDADIIKMMALSLCSSCPTNKMITLLESLVVKYDGLMSYTALLELYEINKLSNFELVNSFMRKNVSLNDLCHQVVLKKLSDPNLDITLYDNIEDYLLGVLASEKLELVDLAIDSAVISPSLELVKSMISLFDNPKMNSLKNALRENLVKIALKKPAYLELMESFLQDDYFLSHLAKSELNTSFVTELSQIVLKKGVEHFNKLKMFVALNMKKNREKLFHETTDINSFFEFWISFNLPLGKTIVSSGIKKFYDKLNDKNKVLFIEQVALNSNLSDIDFFYKEVLKAPSVLGHLVNTFTSPHGRINYE